MHWQHLRMYVMVNKCMTQHSGFCSGFPRVVVNVLVRGHQSYQLGSAVNEWVNIFKYSGN